MTTWWHLEKTWHLDGGWRSLTLGVDARGRIVEHADTKPAGCTSISDFVLPGFPNSHSHAFQYAMAGLSEHLPPGAAGDDFWSWREAMYALALSLSPDMVGTIARVLYAEMLRHGITSVVEFHYLHHDMDGRPYANPAEMSVQLMAAADDAGIHLTLVPVFYQTGGFDQPAGERQRRFLFRDADHYLSHIAAVRKAAMSFDHVNVGIGVHSLRAGKPEDILRILGNKDEAETPKHIHIAEQMKEVDDCLASRGARPVAWLLDQINVDRNFHLVHATHMTAEETERLAKSQATVVICPSTEGNLGDGFFPLPAYLAAGGSIAIGSDSHISLNPWEDLRWLDYGVRLQHRKRNPLCRATGDDSAQTLMQATWTGGMRSRGIHGAEPFAVGTDFDAVVLRSDHPSLLAKPPGRTLSSTVYSGDTSVISRVISHGQDVIEKGAHPKMPAFASRYRDQLSGVIL